MTITVLPDSSYLGSHELVTEGMMGVTRKASIEWDDGSIRKCYVKVYPSIDRVRKICNEFTGFAMAKTLGIFQPDNAAIIPLNSAFFQDYQSAISPDEKKVWAWVTTECGDSLKGKFQLNNFEEAYKSDPIATMKRFEKAYTLICNQKNLPDLIAFDDLIANDDRNIGNLVMVGNGDMGIIDHGEILGRTDWIYSPTTLDKTQYFRNILLNFLNDHSNLKDQTKFTVKSKAVEASNQHHHAVLSIQDMLLVWWKNLLDISDIPLDDRQKYIDMLIEFLHYRSQQPKEFFAHRIGLVA